MYVCIYLLCSIRYCRVSTFIGDKVDNNFTGLYIHTYIHVYYPSIPTQIHTCTHTYTYIQFSLVSISIWVVCVRTYVCMYVCVCVSVN